MSIGITNLHKDIIPTLRVKMPQHVYLECPSNNNVLILWPKNNLAMDVYELDIDDANRTIVSEPEMLTKLLRRASRKMEQKAVHVAFKDYRVVDSSHINKLHSLLEETYCQSEVGDVEGYKTPIIHGTLSLPSNFVLAHDFSKSVRVGTDDPELSMKYLKDNMDMEADRKLWELEGYRLYRSLMTIDGFHTTYGEQVINVGGELIDPAVLIANCATVWTGSLTETVYLEIEEDKHCDLISTSEGKLKPCLIGIPREYYVRMLTIINTYIEF